MQIVDAHLDLSYNVMRGRDVTQPASAQPAIGNEIATVGLPDLRAGNVGLVCATIFCEPHGPDAPQGYRNADEAHRQALTQLAWYRSQFESGAMTPYRGMGASPMRSTTIEAILLLEGADAIRNPDDVALFFNAGVRIVGLAWQRTRYAGGTRAPGPLTSEGRAIVPVLDRFKIIHDISHLAEHSFYQLLDLTAGPIIASHSNCRAIAGGPHNRHLSDDMIHAIIARGGVIGVNFCQDFLVPFHERGQRRATLNDIVAHVKHICQIAGNCDQVGLGTDMDGGLGREQIPIEIQTSSDLPKVANALSSAGFSDDDVSNVLAENWRRFFTAHLPAVVEGSQPG